MSNDLAGLTALVVGEGAIATGIADALTAQGANTRCATASNIGETIGERLDILVIDALCHTATGMIDALGPADFDHALGSVTAAAQAIRAAVPALKAADEGRIILVGHRYGESTGEAIAPYNCAAWALHGLMRSTAIELGQFGITTNLLLPLAETPEMASARNRRAKVIGLMTGQLSLGRIGDPVADIGGAAVMLALPEACFINGQVIHADGGQHIAGPVLNPAKFG